MTTKSVPFFNYPAVFKMHEKELTKAVLDVLEKGAFIMQQELEDFEKNLAEFVGCKYAFGVANGTDALFISLRAAGIGEGDEVIVPSHTFVASPGAIKVVGAVPVLADCGSDHMMDPDKLEALITPKTKAIMPVQLNGRTCNMEKISAIAKKHNLIIVEDSAQALGSNFKGQHAGTFGKAGTFSFYPAKVLGSFGDGGAIVTNDDKMAEEIYKLRDHGRAKDGVIVDWGFNSRLDNVQAAVLDLKLKTYKNDIARRREIATMYQEKLGNLTQLHLPVAPGVQEDHFDVYQNYELEADKRDELQAYLKEQGIGTLIQWSGKAVHQWTDLGFTNNDHLTYTEEMFKKCLMVPMHTALTNEDVDYVCEKIRAFYGA